MNTADTETAARRVLDFLRVRSTQGGMDPEILYTVGTNDGVLDLNTADLELLVRNVLGDVTTREPRRGRSGPTLPDGMTWTEAHRREANHYASAADEETR